MRRRLSALFIGILIVMSIVTVRASYARPVWDNGHLLRDPWFVATLCDAYCGFLTFFVWVAFRERAWSARVGWFVGIMLLGNFAMATYALLQLGKLRPDQSPAELIRGNCSGPPE